MTKNQQAFQRELKRIHRHITSAKKKGIIFTEETLSSLQPSAPKRITKSDIRELSKITKSDIFSKGYKSNPQTGELSPYTPEFKSKRRVPLTEQERRENLAKRREENKKKKLPKEEEPGQPKEEPKEPINNYNEEDYSDYTDTSYPTEDDTPPQESDILYATLTSIISSSENNLTAQYLLGILDNQVETDPNFYARVQDNKQYLIDLAETIVPYQSPSDLIQSVSALYQILTGEPPSFSEMSKIEYLAYTDTHNNSPKLSKKYSKKYNYSNRNTPTGRKNFTNSYFFPD